MAILFVIIGHIKFGLNYPAFFYNLSQFIEFGSLGVQVFFVISGFLITGLLLKEKAATGTIDLGNFYTRRSLRIFPVFFIYIIVISLLKFFHIAIVNSKAILAALLLITNFGNFHSQWLIAHSWSLAVEQQFYFCWPIAVVFMPRKYTYIFAGIIIYYLLYYYLRHYPLLYIVRGFVMVAPPIVLGATLSIALFKGWLTKVHSILMHPLFAFSLFYAVAMYIPRAFNTAPLFYIPLDYILSSFFIVVFLYYAIHCSSSNPVYKILNFPVITYIGILSYSIYIWQQPFFSTENSFQIYPVWARFPVNIVLAFIMAFISYNLIEKPFLTLKKHFKKIQ